MSENKLVGTFELPLPPQSNKVKPTFVIAYQEFGKGCETILRFQCGDEAFKVYQELEKLEEVGEIQEIYYYTTEF